MSDLREQGWEEIGQRLRDHAPGAANDADFAAFQAMRAGGANAPAKRGGLPWAWISLAALLLLLGAILVYNYAGTSGDGPAATVAPDESVATRPAPDGPVKPVPGKDPGTGELSAETPADRSVTTAPMTVVEEAKDERVRNPVNQSSSSIRPQGITGSVIAAPEPVGAERAAAEPTGADASEATGGEEPASTNFSAISQGTVADARRAVAAQMIPTLTIEAVASWAFTFEIPGVTSVAEPGPFTSANGNGIGVSVAGGLQANLGRQTGFGLHQPSGFGYVEIGRDLTPKFSLGLRFGAASYGSAADHDQSSIVAVGTKSFRSPNSENVTYRQVAEVDDMATLDLSLVGYYHLTPRLSLALGGRASYVRTSLLFTSNTAGNTLLIDQTGAAVEKKDFGLLVGSEYRFLGGTRFGIEYTRGLFDLNPAINESMLVDGLLSNSGALRTTAARLYLKQSF